MRLFSWSFPQTASIVVSRILRISGSLRHELNSKNLQNKQSIDGGVSAGSPMLNIVGEIESVKNVGLVGRYFHISFLLALLPLFMKKDDDPFFYGKWVICFQN